MRKFKASCFVCVMTCMLDCHDCLRATRRYTVYFTLSYLGVLIAFLCLTSSCQVVYLLSPTSICPLTPTSTPTRLSRPATAHLHISPPTQDPITTSRIEMVLVSEATDTHVDPVRQGVDFNRHEPDPRRNI